jgi:hypothetical protein
VELPLTIRVLALHNDGREITVLAVAKKSHAQVRTVFHTVSPATGEVTRTFPLPPSLSTATDGYKLTADATNYYVFTSGHLGIISRHTTEKLAIFTPFPSTTVRDIHCFGMGKIAIISSQALVTVDFSDAKLIEKVQAVVQSAERASFVYSMSEGSLVKTATEILKCPAAALESRILIINGIDAVRYAFQTFRFLAKPFFFFGVSASGHGQCDS